MDEARGDARHAAAERGKGGADLLDAARLVYWGQQAARAGDRSVARLLLTRALEFDPLHEEAWLWRAGTAPQPEEALGDLEHLLQINPEHSRARLGLIAIREQLTFANGADPEPPAPPSQDVTDRSSNHRPSWRPRLVALALAAAVGLLLPTHQPTSSQIWPDDSPLLAEAPDASPETIDLAMLASNQPEDSLIPDNTLQNTDLIAPDSAQATPVGATHASPAQPAPPTSAEDDQPDPAELTTVASLKPVPDLQSQDAARLAGQTHSGTLTGVSSIGGDGASAATPTQSPARAPGETLAPASPDPRLPSRSGATGSTPDPQQQAEPTALLSELARPSEKPAVGRTATGHTEKPWVAVHRATGLWSGPNTRARLFRTVEPGDRFQVALPQNGPRFYVWDPTTENYAYVDAVDVGPAGPPWEKPKSPPAEKKPPVPAPVNPVQTEPSLMWPARGPITTYFGFVGPYSPRGHAGLDIAAPYGASILAAEAGQVSLSTTAGGPYGFEIIIDHAFNLQTLYAHLSQLHVATGQAVARGQLIGLVGSTGYSTGPHLHFEVRQGGALRDPLAFLP